MTSHYQNDNINNSNRYEKIRNRDGHSDVGRHHNDGDAQVSEHSMDTHP